MDELVSVLIAAYNVEKYVVECLLSVINQTHRNLEIIVVVSTSQDYTEQIIQAIAATDDRISVIVEDVLGVGHARNTGLRNSHGDYIVFVDPDDRVEPTYVETLLQLSKQSDGIAMCSHKEINNTRFHPVDIAGGTERVFTGQELCHYMFRPNGWVEMAVLWNKMFRRDVLDGVTIPSLRMSEDEAIMYRLIYPRKLVRVSPKQLYHYRAMRAGGLTGADFNESNLSGIDVRLKRRQFFADHGEQELVAKADFMIVNDMGLTWVYLPRIYPLHHPLHSQLWKIVVDATRNVMVNKKSKWWARPVAIAFLVEFVVWKLFIIVIEYIQTYYTHRQTR